MIRQELLECGFRQTHEDAWPDRENACGSCGTREQGNLSDRLAATHFPEQPSASVLGSRYDPQTPAHNEEDLTGVRAFDRQWDVRVDDSHVTVEEA